MLPKILIVEDSILLRSILRNALREAGYIVYEAENGRVALTSVKEIQPALVLLDVLMPVMDGMVAYEELQKEDWGKHVPVILLTSSEGSDVLEWIATKGLSSIKKDDQMVQSVIAAIAERLS